MDSRSGKEQYGCAGLIIRAITLIVAVFVIEYVVTFIFHRLYPFDETTIALKPFQNNYLAQTDAFITSEWAVSEFTTDSGPASRFLGLCIVPLVGIIMLAALLYAIPLTRKAIDYTWHAVFVAFAILMIDAMFFPPVMTVFDRENKKMIVHRPSMFFFGTKTEIPFGQVTGFTHEPHLADGVDHYDDVMYADLFAITADGKVFIGDNEMSTERRPEIEDALKALHKLIGK